MLKSDKKYNIQKVIENAKIEKARRDPNFRIEYLMKTERGEHINQGEIHYVWQYHILFGWKLKMIPAILGMWQHGKSIQVVSPLLAEIGENKNIRLAYISDTENTAKKRASLIGDMVRDNERFKKVYPHIMPSKTKRWSRANWTLERDKDVNIIDETMQVSGVLGGRTGQRYDIVVIDDPCNISNTIQQPADRKRVIDTIDTLLGRMDVNGKALWIATSFHKDDANERIKSLPSYLVIEHGVNDNITKINTKVYNIPQDHEEEYFEGIRHLIKEYDLKRFTLVPEFKKKYWAFDMPLWKERPRSFLVRRKGEISPIKFAWGYQQRVYDESQFMFRNFIDCVVEVDTHMVWSDERQMIAMKNEWLFSSDLIDHKKQLIVGSVDLSTPKRKGNIICIIGVDKVTNRKTLFHIYAMADKSTEVAKEIQKCHKLFGVEMWFVENNAIQTMFTDILDLYNQREREKKDATFSQIPVMEFTTHGNKRDPSIGLQSLQIEFQSNMWIIPRWGKHSQDGCKCSYCKMIEEFTMYPQGETNDTVMATWIAREGSRWYLREDDEMDKTILSLNRNFNNRFGNIDINKEVGELQKELNSLTEELRI